MTPDQQAILPRNRGVRWRLDSTASSLMSAAIDEQCRSGKILRIL